MLIKTSVENFMVLETHSKCSKCFPCFMKIFETDTIWNYLEWCNTPTCDE